MFEMGTRKADSRFFYNWLYGPGHMSGRPPEGLNVFFFLITQQEAQGLDKPGESVIALTEPVCPWSKLVQQDVRLPELCLSYKLQWALAAKAG